MIKSLHGLRGLAALSVLVGHTIVGSINASLGVLLFFVLSGFLMGRLYLQKKASLSGVAKYAVARFARIYPLFAFVIIGTAALNAMTGAEIFGLETYQVDRHLLLAGSALTVWTISAEFQFYAFFVLLWLFYSRGSIGFAGLVMCLLPALFLGLFVGADLGRISILRYLHIFLIGMLIALILPRMSERAKFAGAWMLPALIIAYLIVPTYVTADWFAGSVYEDPIAIAICGGLVLCAVLAADSPFGNALGGPLPYWLGEISFGIYLFHRHAQWLVREALGSSSGVWVELAAVTVISLILAQLGYWLIESPGRRYGRMIGDNLVELALRRRATA